MIAAKFALKNSRPTGFKVSGHAGYAESGKDIVCAAVSSAVQLTANAVTEVLGADAEVNVGENEITLALKGENAAASQFIQALILHLQLLNEDYGDYINISFSEV